MNTSSTSIPQLSIAVLSWNSRDITRRCIASILTNTEKTNFELCIVENGSHDGSRAMLYKAFPQEKYPNIHLLVNEINKGFAEGNNQAFRASRGKYFLMLNSDTIIPPRTIDAMVAFLEQHPDYAAVTTRLCNPDGSTQYYMHRRFPTVAALCLAFFHKRFPVVRPRAVVRYCYLDKNFQHDFDIEQAAGACLMVRRDIITSIGGLFDAEHFPLYYNDVDLCARLWQNHFRIRCLTNVFITHAKGTSVRSLSFTQNSSAYVSASLWYFRARKKYVNFYLLRLVYLLLFCILSITIPVQLLIRRISFSEARQMITILQTVLRNRAH